MSEATGRPDRSVDRVHVDQIIEEFRDLDPREKLESLVDYAAGLPPLDEDHRLRMAAGENRIHECQTPVHLWIGLRDDRIDLTAAVAPEAPTVKGFVAILREILQGRPMEAIGDVPDDFLERLGLVEVLGILRSRGLRAILARVKRGVAAAKPLSKEESRPAAPAPGPGIDPNHQGRGV
jgi:cysteine desulfuration protein SufE